MFLIGLCKKVFLSIFIGLVFIFLGGLAVYLGRSISDLFLAICIILGTLIFLLYLKLKKTEDVKAVYWCSFEFLGFSFLTLVLCLMTDQMFHHFIYATTFLIYSFKTIPLIVAEFFKKYKQINPSDISIE